MSQSYVIEIDDESVGLVVRGEGARRFVFHAASSRFRALDGFAFASVGAAEKAVRTLGTGGAVPDRPRAAAGGR